MGKVEPHCLGKRTKISTDFEHSVVATPIPVMNIVITNFHSPPIFYVSTRTGWHAMSRSRPGNRFSLPRMGAMHPVSGRGGQYHNLQRH